MHSVSKLGPRRTGDKVGYVDGRLVFDVVIDNVSITTLYGRKQLMRGLTKWLMVKVGVLDKPSPAPKENDA